MNLSKLSLVLLITTVTAVGFSAGLLTAHFQVRQFVRREFRLPPPPERLDEPMRERHRGQMRRRALDDLTRRLDLAPEQRQRVQSIMDRHMQEMREQERSFRESVHAIMERTDREVREGLDARQQARFEEWRRRFRPGGRGPR